ncbi:uncharacterized protein PHACADRAFT_212408 [Phanerochaete carnosa HHB-10118-sp]|uniref:F-box domain-containing protein n=1 Tax=Phanerochaete carnosa (strain HHB-10118-sp) TaxID=650164 RepID=K5UPT6_PHACS|nr:uncharacterized protein PHACADRAFT_212408 [Phanerochaete carnosa HHB-10118-sp]EKM51791.1 hypothetical protein PHACADRAFT_212408 [Phanerochaete carnosa HHB-10118-sp]
MLNLATRCSTYSVERRGGTVVDDTFTLVPSVHIPRQARMLSVSPPSYPEIRIPPHHGEGGLLADIFTHSTNLEHLDFSTSILLDADDRISPALSALRQLHILKLLNLTKHTVGMLKQMQAPLTKVVVSLVRRDDPSRRTDMDPVPIFARFKDSLRVMSVTFPNFASTEVQYPRVETLNAFRTNRELRPLLHCFPNLKNCLILVHPHEVSLDDWQIEVQRRFNITLPTSWSSFNRLIGGIETLYMLAVRCKVDHLSVTGPFAFSTGALRKLTSVLDDARPTWLTLQIKVKENDLPPLGRRLSIAGSSISKMLLRLDFYGPRFADPSLHIRTPQSLHSHSISQSIL